MDQIFFCLKTTFSITFRKTSIFNENKFNLILLVFRATHDLALTTCKRIETVRSPLRYGLLRLFVFPGK